MIESRELCARRGSTWLFEALALRVKTGEALCLRGPNGAGKTTLLRILCGLTRAEGGSIFWQGEQRSEALRGVAAYAGHQPGLSADLSVRQNLEFYSALDGRPGSWTTVLEALGLGRCRDLQVRHLSAGQKRRAGLVRVLASVRPVWLLDEPFTNVDAAGRRVIEQHIDAHLASGGLAVVALHGELDLRGGRVVALELGTD